MTGTEAAWLPWAGAALGGLGGYLGGSRPEQAQITGYGQKFPALHPEQLFKGATGDLGRLGALYAQRAQMPVSMPSSYVQPLPMFKGGIVDAFGLGMDPAFPRPELMTRSGVNFGSEEALPFQSSLGSQVAKGGRDVYGSSTQPASPFPTFGGAHAELGDMQKALSMLRPSGPPSLEYLPKNFDFSGARGDNDTNNDQDRVDPPGNDDPPKIPTYPVRDVDKTPYGSPREGYDPSTGLPWVAGPVTDSSGVVLPIDPSTGEDMGKPFPGGEYAPIPGMSDPDNPGSSFMPDQTDFMRGVTRRGQHVSPPRFDPLTGQPLESPPGVPRRPKLGTTLPPESVPGQSGFSSSFLPPPPNETGPFFPFPGDFDPNVRRPTRKTASTSGLPPGPYKSIDRG
tara:strand:+ start:1990 stop:3177 length:1188 start_codon:yes stop_codon:yes gene_type:complete